MLFFSAFNSKSGHYLLSLYGTSFCGLQKNNMVLKLDMTYDLKIVRYNEQTVPVSLIFVQIQLNMSCKYFMYKMEEQI